MSPGASQIRSCPVFSALAPQVIGSSAMAVRWLGFPGPGKFDGEYT